MGNYNKIFGHLKTFAFLVLQPGRCPSAIWNPLAALRRM